MFHDNPVRDPISSLTVVDAAPERLGGSRSLLLPAARQYKTLRVVLIQAVQVRR